MGPRRSASLTCCAPAERSPEKRRGAVDGEASTRNAFLRLGAKPSPEKQPGGLWAHNPPNPPFFSSVHLSDPSSMCPGPRKHREADDLMSFGCLNGLFVLGRSMGHAAAATSWGWYMLGILPPPPPPLSAPISEKRWMIATRISRVWRSLIIESRHKVRGASCLLPESTPLRLHRPPPGPAEVSSGDLEALSIGRV